MYDFYLSKSKAKGKKWAIYSVQTDKTINFGSEPYQDYTQHKNEDRKKLYINRHKKNENWNKSGIMTAGFWSRWLLWNKPTISESIDNMESKFNIKIIRKS